MASTNFTNLTRALMKGDLNFLTNTCKVLLISAIPSETNLDTWVNRSDVTTEITGTGYTSGGIAQPFTFNAIDTTNNKQSVSFTNIVNGWTASTFNAVGALIYKNSGTSTTDTLITFCDFSGTVSCSNGNFSITYTSTLDLFR